ncbi:uncharacterized protein LOC144165117 isoform X2 [Haemaphysalis longicornis]
MSTITLSCTVRWTELRARSHLDYIKTQRGRSWPYTPVTLVWQGTRSSYPGFISNGQENGSFRWAPASGVFALQQSVIEC